jgi:hypothetical protein
MKICHYQVLIAIALLLVGFPLDACGQSDAVTKKTIRLQPQSAQAGKTLFHLLPSEEEQEAGNAVPVLLRMVYEQQPFMQEVYPKLNDYAVMELDDPKLKEFSYGSFARQLIRAGSMSYADWQYPLRSDRPYHILLPDVQSQRMLAGRGMTGWIKRLLAEGKTEEALICIKAQMACGRHCAATPVIVCHLVGLAIANFAFENIELAIQQGDCPNLYWSLASLPPTLHDLGPMVRWELWASPTSSSEESPPIGDAKWKELAARFVENYGEAVAERYTPEEGLKLQNQISDLATKQLPETFGFSSTEIERMSKEELIMRWIHMQNNRFRNHVEPLTYLRPLQVIEAKKRIESDVNELLAKTGAKSSPFPVVIPQGILICRTFERRVKLLQTIESLRDYASKHNGEFPKSLGELDLPAPNDPFTEMPFEYEWTSEGAKLRQAEVEGFKTQLFEYELLSPK